MVHTDLIFSAFLRRIFGPENKPAEAVQYSREITHYDIKC